MGYEQMMKRGRADGRTVEGRFGYVQDSADDQDDDDNGDDDDDEEEERR
jgi:hypothetical protein